MSVKNGLAGVVLILAIFLLASGIPSYLLYLMRVYPLTNREILAFSRTPIALFLLTLGTLGLLGLYSLRNENPSVKAWFKMAVYFGMVMLAWSWLEALLATSYRK